MLGASSSLEFAKGGRLPQLAMLDSHQHVSLESLQRNLGALAVSAVKAVDMLAFNNNQQAMTFDYDYSAIQGGGP